MGTCDPRYRLSCTKLMAQIQKLHYFLCTVSLLGIWVYLNCAHSGWYLPHSAPGRPECTMPQSCPAFDHFFLAARYALLPEELQKMLPPVSEAVKYGDRRGGLSFQPAREDINQGADPLLPGANDHPLRLLFNLLDSCHPTQTPNIHLTSEVSSSKQPVVLLWAHCKSDIKLSHPSKPAPVFDLWRFAAFLLCSWGLGERGEKGKWGQRSGAGAQLSWLLCRAAFI